jgi:tripeptidyl-peptidase-1
MSPLTVLLPSKSFTPFLTTQILTISHSYVIIDNNQTSQTGGTSAASPVFAAIIALVNDALLKAGKPQLGFLNPWLYSNGLNGLTDITGGGSVGCNGVNGQTGASIPGASIILYASWNATPGWDPVTGLGVPNFQKLKQLALS